MSSLVGFDRKIKVEWLDAVADRAAQGSDPAQVRLFLHEILKKEHPGETARKKTITVLMRIWVMVPDGRRPMQEEAFALLREVPMRDRIWLHWGMVVLAYPLFWDTATAIGRLVKLQGDFRLAQLHRRLVDNWGERSTVKRAFRRIVRSMVDWQALRQTERRGQFVTNARLATKSKALELWMLKAAHVASGRKTIECSELLNLPSLFPFKVTIPKARLKRSVDFTFHTQGADLDMVGISPDAWKNPHAEKAMKAG